MVQKLPTHIVTFKTKVHGKPGDRLRAKWLMGDVVKRTFILRQIPAEGSSWFGDFKGAVDL